MRTATEDAEDLERYVDAFLAREYAMAPGGFLENVMRAFDASPDARLDEVEALDMAPEAGDTGTKHTLWAAHHIARAKRLDEEGDPVLAYQQLVEAYKSVGNLTAYTLILHRLSDKANLMKKAQASRHSVIKDIEAFAVARFKEGVFPSAHKASIAITEEVRRYAADKGRPLSEDRATKTIYEWLLRVSKQEN